eukprot:2251840-Rhodomonas_salina.1
MDAECVWEACCSKFSVRWKGSRYLEGRERAHTADLLDVCGGGLYISPALAEPAAPHQREAATTPPSWKAAQQHERNARGTRERSERGARQ